jgi:hypothetical protein
MTPIFASKVVAPKKFLPPVGAYEEKQKSQHKPSAARGTRHITPNGSELHTLAHNIPKQSIWQKLNSIAIEPVAKSDPQIFVKVSCSQN